VTVGELGALVAVVPQQMRMSRPICRSLTAAPGVTMVV